MSQRDPDPAFWSSRRVCVTGGSGFLGWQVARRLVELGSEVRVLALRPDESHPIGIEQRINSFFGDVRDADLVRRAVSGCSVIFHTAGFVSGWGRLRERMWSVHVDGTSTVLSAAAPGTRMIHTSSLTTIGASRNGEILNEDSAFERTDEKIAYVAAKRAAEELALRAAGAGLDVVVTNPGYLVGPEDHERSIMGRFCVRFWKGRVPAAPPGGLNLVDVRDTAVGHLLAAELGTSGRRYILGGENHAFTSFMRQLAEAAQYDPRGYPRAPRSVVIMVAAMSEFRGFLMNREPYPSFDHARLTSRCWFGSSQRAVDELGYRVRPLIESLREAYAWHHGRGPIQPRGINRWWVRPPQ